MWVPLCFCWPWGQKGEHALERSPTEECLHRPHYSTHLTEKLHLCCAVQTLVAVAAVGVETRVAAKWVAWHLYQRHTGQRLPVVADVAAIVAKPQRFHCVAIAVVAVSEQTGVCVQLCLGCCFVLSVQRNYAQHCHWMVPSR